ncbi:MAG: hypothetical protein NC548_64530 [Lachnospiraceae bacterium]|nr:hypothetical protein [Lachnospiraceae bacterium]
MKRDKMADIILAAVNAVLAVVCIVLYFRTDRTEPRFIIQPAEITYRPDMEERLLYEGIAAHDDRDGEITDRIVIEKKIENRAEGSVIVYYAVSDSAGNVAKFSKLFSAEYPVEVQAAASEAGGGEPVIRQLAMDRMASDSTAGDGNDSDAGADQEKDDAENGAAGSDGDEGVEIENSDEDAGTADGEDGGNEEEAGDDRGDAPDNGNGDVQTVQEPALLTRSTGAPELVFRTTEVTIDAGTNVPWTEIISTLRDDKDDYATLYYNLQVSQYNRSRPGTYPVTVYTEDSDGNRSQTVSVTITVR